MDFWTFADIEDAKEHRRFDYLDFLDKLRGAANWIVHDVPEASDLILKAVDKISAYMQANDLYPHYWPGWREETKAKILKILEEGNGLGAAGDVITSWAGVDPEIGGGFGNVQS